MAEELIAGQTGGPVPMPGHDGASRSVSAHEYGGAGGPLVSVVIPVYNVSRYLPQCLESVLAQTYQNVEVLIVDDGSTDGSGSICDRFAERDSRIRVIHTDNRGLSAARNLGLENISGAFIFFIDSDDWIEPNTVETLVKAALRTKADVVTMKACMEFVGKTSNLRAGKKRSRIYRGVDKSADTFRGGDKSAVTLRDGDKSAVTFRGGDILAAYAEGLLGNAAWNKLYRAECFRDLRFPYGHNYEDVVVAWKLMKELAENGRAVTALPEVLYHFRARKSSISHTWTLDNVCDCWEAYHGKFEGLPDYREKLLPECFVAIRRMWVSFESYSREDRARAEATVREMQIFSKKHFLEVMRGEYSARAKMTCLLSQSRSAPAMWAGACGGKLWRAFWRRKNEMFE